MSAFAARALGALGGVAAYGVARWAMRSLDVLPPASRRRWERTNHSGASVTLLEGPVYAVSATVGAALAGAFVPGAQVAPGACAALGAAGFGALDDLAGDGSSKGLRGHLSALTRGEVTTGAVKIVGLAGTGLMSAALADRARPGRSIPTTIIGGVAIAGCANLINLFDLRPGRALKVSIAGGIPFVVGGSAASAVTAASAIGAAVGVLPEDLRAESMLGDTGANAAGAMIGVALVQSFGARGRLATIAVVTALTLASERISFSDVIAHNEWLRRLDAWGRQ